MCNPLVKPLKKYTAFAELAGKLEKGVTTIKRQKLPATKDLLPKYNGSSLQSVKLYICYPVLPTTNQNQNQNQRLCTYSVGWPTTTKVWPIQLSNAGFYFTGQGTTVRCTGCGVDTSVETWITPEKPEVVHFKLNNQCEFLLRNFPNLRSEIDRDKNTSERGRNPQSVLLEEEVVEHVPPLTEGNHSQNDHARADTTSNDQVIKRPMSFELQNKTSVHRDNSTIKANVSNNVGLERGFGSIRISENDMVSRLQNRAYNLPTNLLSSPYNNSRISNTHGLSGLGFDTAHASTLLMNFLPSNSIPNRVYEPEFSHPEYRESEQRLTTFRHWVKEKIQSPMSLVDSGFYYTGEENIVRCFCCNLGISEWTADDNPWTEHARYKPKCWFLKHRKGQDYIDQVQETWRKKYNPKNPAFDDYQSRLLTFGGWREDISQTPEELADAGFFFIGEEDIVRCHYCDGQLRNWESGDVPWEEHARWFRLCKYLIKMKGTRYIESIQKKYKNGPPTAGANFQESERETEVVKTALRVGFTDAEVKAAVNKYVQTRGNRDFTEGDLLEIIFEIKSPTSTINKDSVISNRPIPDIKDRNTLRNINRELVSNLICVLCKQNESCMLFVNCGHRVTCQQCCRSIDFCPTCDKRVKRVIKVFVN